MNVTFLQNLRIREKIKQNLQLSGECFLWTGRTNLNGYGMVGFQSRQWLVHRLVWTLQKGDIPEGLLVCHKCDIRACANLAHLFLGTYADNNAAMDAKGRRGRASLLTETDARNVRRLRSMGETYASIAAMIPHCNPSIAKQICTGRSWRNA